MENKTAELVTLKISVMPNPILSERGRLYNDNLSVAEIRANSVTVARHRQMVQIQFDSVRLDQKENLLKV